MAGEARIKLGLETSSLQKSIKDSIARLEQLSNKYKELNDKLKERGPEDFAKTLDKALESNSKAIDRQRIKLDKLASQYAKYQKQYETALSNKDEQGANMAKRNMDSIDSQDLEATNELLRLENERDNIISKTTQSYNNQTEAIKSQLNETKQNFNALNAIMEDDVKKVNKLSSVFEKVKATTKDVVSTIGTKLSNAFNSIFEKKDNGAMFKSMATSAKQMMMALLGARGAFTLIRKLVSQIKDDNKELANTINTLWTALVQLVTPIVNTIVNALATALNYVIKMVSAISGINILGKINQAQKKSKSSSGSSSSKLYSFDTSETLNKSGGGSSTTASYMKDVELNDKLLGYAEKLKSIWSDIQKIAKNIVDRVKEGVNYMDSGTRILQSLDSFVNSFLDHIKEMTSATVKWSESINFGPLFDSFATLLEALQPLLSTVGDLLVWIYTECILPVATYLIETLAPAFNNLIAPVLTLINSILEAVGGVLLELWNNTLVPLFDYISGTIGPILDTIAKKITENTGTITTIWETMATLISWLITVLVPAIELVWTFVVGVFEGVSKSCGDMIDGIALSLNGIIDFISGVFAGDWAKAWNGIKDIFGGIWNSLLGIISGVLNGVIYGINKVIDWINSKLHVTIPDWVPFIGGKEYSVNIPQIEPADLSAYKYVPKLATGAIIPPNKEFLAMLGDQTRGRNIEAPEGLLREIVQEESGTQEINIVADGSLSQFIKLLRFELQKEDKRVGTNLVVGG